MDTDIQMQMRNLFTEYLLEKELRKTAERYAVFDCVCSISGHFDMEMLYQKLDSEKFHVSRTTLYNTIELLVNARLIVRHQFGGSQSVQYELANEAKMHYHQICTRCGCIRELKDDNLMEMIRSKKVTKFTPEFYSLYIYGVCSKCKFKIQQKIIK
ncbi:MAG: Fur family transcriptional regulator [Tannerellaceae bacterium]